MHETSKPRVKICCISSVDEARLAIEHGASALGLVSSMPSGPGVISEDLIAEIAATVPPGIGTFLLTCETRPESLIDQQRRTRVNTLQLVDSVLPGTHAALRRALPGVSIVQVIHVRGQQSVAEAAEVARHVDAILLDSGNPALAVKELGGTGRVHDWQLSRQIRESIPRPIFLAGGLRPDNVGEAIRQVGPYGLDLCSGVRTAGKLDAAKLAAFFQSVERAARDASNFAGS
jgi:phosphoribosylanthranilate isomerase